MDPEGQAQVASFGGKHLSMLSHLISPSSQSLWVGTRHRPFSDNHTSLAQAHSSSIHSGFVRLSTFPVSGLPENILGQGRGSSENVKLPWSRWGAAQVSGQKWGLILCLLLTWFLQLEVTSLCANRVLNGHLVRVPGAWAASLLSGINMVCW